MTATPPLVTGGAPLFGHALDFVKAPLPLLERGQREHGRAFSLALGKERMAVLLGPEHNRWFFRNTDRLLSLRGGYPFMVRMFDEDTYFLAEPETYKEQRRVIRPRFRGATLDGYVAPMVDETLRLFGRLGDTATFDLLDELGPLVMHVAALTFLGRDFRERLSRDFFEIFRDFSAGLDPVTPPWLPLPHLRRSKRARQRLHAWIAGLLAERRERPVDPPDFLQTLVTSTGSDGEPLSDGTITQLVLLLTWAGHETTAGHLAWALVDLLQNPRHLGRVLAEIDEVVEEPDALAPEGARRLVRLERALKETERLHPVAYVLTRRASEDLEVGDLRIPAGWLVSACPWLSHRLPEHFEDPDVYDPGRFDEGALPEHSVIGFGGGVHRCAGVHFAYLEMKIVLALLLRRYDLRLLDPEPVPVSGSATKWPASPCRVRLRRRRDVPPLAELPERASAPPAASRCPFHRALGLG